MLAHLFSARENTEGTNTGSCQFVFSDVELSAMPSQVLGPVCRRRSRFHLVARGRAADMAVADSGRFRNLPPSKPNWHPSQSVCSSGGWILEVTAVGFEPTPFRNGALSHRLGQAPHGSWMIQVGGDTSRALRRWGQHGKGDGAFLGGRKRGQNFCGPPNVTVAILAQGTHWAVAVTQALFVAGSIPTRNTFPLDLPLSEPLLCTTPLVRLHHNLKGCFCPRPCLRASGCPWRRRGGGPP